MEKLLSHCFDSLVDKDVSKNWIIIKSIMAPWQVDEPVSMAPSPQWQADVFWLDPTVSYWSKGHLLVVKVYL